MYDKMGYNHTISISAEVYLHEDFQELKKNRKLSGVINQFLKDYVHGNDKTETELKHQLNVLRADLVRIKTQSEEYKKLYEKEKARIQYYGG